MLPDTARLPNKRMHACHCSDTFHIASHVTPASLLSQHVWKGPTCHRVVAANTDGMIWRSAVLQCTQFMCLVSLHCCNLKVELRVCGVSAGSEDAVPHASTAALHDGQLEG